MDWLHHFVSVLDPRLARSSSSWSSASGSAPVDPESSASFEGYRSCTTNNVLPAFSSKVTVVTVLPLSPSSLVQTRREYGVTSRYVPKNSIVESSWRNTRRYCPPTRTSISQESRVRPYDFGTHHLLNSSALVQASNTRRAGALTVRVTTSSRSDFRSTPVRFLVGVASLSLLTSICFLLPFQFLDNNVQLVEARGPELAMPLDPCRLFFQSAQPELAGPHA